MNIFYIDNDPALAAQMLCDKHVVKMPLETAQLLSTAHHIHGSDFVDEIYKKTHINHPVTKWVAASRAHYKWTVSHFSALLTEYEFRYKKKHACEKLWTFLKNVPDIPTSKWTDPPQCVSERYKDPHDSTVNVYRKYYFNEKRKFAEWKHGKGVPVWYLSLSQNKG